MTSGLALGTTRRRSPWLAPVGLIALSLFPILGGFVRLTELTGGAAVTPLNERFFETPLAVTLHIVSATAYSLLGALQFAPALRGSRWHRGAGRLLVPLGALAASSGLWLAVLYFMAVENALLLVVRLTIGSSMLVSLALGVYHVVRFRDLSRHRAWMTRAYAIGAAAGTEALLVVGPELLSGSPSGAAQVVSTAGAWAINLAAAEYIIRRQTSPIAQDRPTAS